MRPPRSKPQKPPPDAIDPDAVARAKQFLEETNWEKYWAELSERMQNDATYSDFSFFIQSDRGK